VIGPHTELVGRRAGDLPRARASEDDGESPHATIDQVADLRFVDPASRFIPGQITGTIERGRPGGGRAVALAVNGSIAATGRTFSLEGTPKVENFEVMAPESAFRRGPNAARLFEIVPGPAGLALRPL
jgi:hypothetical protein